MIVDDELPALTIAESVLRAFKNVNICGAFSDADKLLECLSTTEVDLLFVDMKMPEIHGLELAGRIQDIKPEASVVFVTAYDDYAVEAFEAEALDYIMKPITAERVQKTLERYVKRFRTQQHEKTSGRIISRCFGRFSFENELGKQVKFRTSKSEELLAFLLHNMGKPVSKYKIMEELWYDRDTEKAQSMLYTTLYQLRKDLENFGLNDVITHSRKEGGLCQLLRLPDECDYKDFVDGYREYKSGNFSVDRAKHIVEIYKTGYLEANGYAWSLERKNELELNCAELIEKISDHEVCIGRFEFAMQYLKKWAEMFPFTERVHFKIIALYLLMNNKDLARNYYFQAKEMFNEELGITLHIDIELLDLNPAIAFNEQK